MLNFINKESAYFIVGSILKDNYTFGHHALYIFPEFELPPNFRVDYLLVGKSSGGYEFIFVELESIYKNITIKDGSFGETIRKGLRQIEDWDSWIEANFSHLRLVFEKLLKDGENLPKEFLELDKSRIHYALVAGKRSDYNEKTYRLRRKHQKENEVLILHYDNLFDFSIKIIGDTNY